jgi:hypothetical protein
LHGLEEFVQFLKDHFIDFIGRKMVTLEERYVFGYRVTGGTQFETYPPLAHT